MITGADLYKSFGDPFTTEDEGIYMKLWEVPYDLWNHIPAIPRKIYCNEQMVIPLEAAFLTVLSEGLEGEIKTWDGCYNIRPIRGYESTLKRLMSEGKIEAAMRYASVHCWACAIDINAAWNRLGKKPQMNSRLVDCFTKNGFDWGGDFKRKDGMHFQLSYLK